MTETPAAPEAAPAAPALDPAGFDLDAWMDGVQRLRAIVTLYARRDLMPQIDAIVAELEPLAERLSRGERSEQRPDESMAEAGVQLRRDHDRRDELREQLKQVWAQYEASGVDFELEQLSSDDYDEIVDAVDAAHPDPAFDAPDAEQLKVGIARNEMSAREVLLRSVKAAGPHGQPRTPTTLTSERLSKLQKRFGVDQFGELIGQARALTLESRVDAPFSQRVSAILGETNSG